MANNYVNFSLHKMLQYLLAHEVNGASSVDVNEVDRGLGADELSTARHGVGVGTTHLYTKYVLALVTLQ